MQFTQNQYTIRFIESVNFLIDKKIVKNRAEICRDLEIIVQSFSQIMTGKVNITMDLLSKSFTFYKISPIYILSGEGNIVLSSEEYSDLISKENCYPKLLPKLLPNSYKQPENAGFNIANEPQASYGNTSKKEEGLKELSTALKAYMEANNALMAYIGTLEAKLSNYEGNNNTS